MLADNLLLAYVVLLVRRVQHGERVVWLKVRLLVVNCCLSFLFLNRLWNLVLVLTLIN